VTTLRLHSSKSRSPHASLAISDAIISPYRKLLHPAQKPTQV
jgi:hypothetical protein